MGSDGMKLYVDGQLAASNPNTQSENYPGYWRIGGDTTWGGATSNYFAGRIDEVAVYSSALSAAQVADHYAKGGGQPANTPPTASFTAVPNGLASAFDGVGLHRRRRHRRVLRVGLRRRRHRPPAPPRTTPTRRRAPTP